MNTSAGTGTRFPSSNRTLRVHTCAHLGLMMMIIIIIVIIISSSSRHTSCFRHTGRAFHSSDHYVFGGMFSSDKLKHLRIVACDFQQQSSHGVGHHLCQSLSVDPVLQYCLHRPKRVHFSTGTTNSTTSRCRCCVTLQLAPNFFVTTWSNDNNFGSSAYPIVDGVVTSSITCVQSNQNVAHIPLVAFPGPSRINTSLNAATIINTNINTTFGRFTERVSNTSLNERQSFEIWR
mmetsp:Transcript_2476/g.4360  ORF Transcript_2476/g.4360 Transcript_2476/m.4360 type:complete len:233 (+) Transcript_2476:1500-2198(+)